MRVNTVLISISMEPKMRKLGLLYSPQEGGGKLIVATEYDLGLLKSKHSQTQWLTKIT